MLPLCVIWAYSETRGGSDGLAKYQIPTARATMTTIATRLIRRGGFAVFRGALTSISFGSRGAISRESDHAFRAKPKSEADWKRCSGFFSRHRCTTLCNAVGRFGAICEMR